MHLEGFRTALTKVINDYGRRQNIIKEKDANLTGDDIREGPHGGHLREAARPAVRGPDQGQARQLLHAHAHQPHRVPGARGVPGGASQPGARDPQEGLPGRQGPPRRAEGAPGHAPQEPARERGAARQAGRLLRCASPRDDRAVHRGGATRQAARPRTAAAATIQAILPLRGKILNVERVGDHRAFSCDTIQALITAVGTGVTNGLNGEGGDFDLCKARYHKIIIMTDADVDGAHIRILLMTFFYKYMRPLIDAGYVYIATARRSSASRSAQEDPLRLSRRQDARGRDPQQHARSASSASSRQRVTRLRTRRTRGPGRRRQGLGPQAASPATPCSATRAWARWIPKQLACTTMDPQDAHPAAG